MNIILVAVGAYLYIITYTGWNVLCRKKTTILC